MTVFSIYVNESCTSTSIWRQKSVIMFVKLSNIDWKSLLQ